MAILRSGGVLFGLLLIVGSARADGIYHNGWNDLNKNGQKDRYEDPAVPVEQRIADLLERMTLEEKTCQMSTIYGYKRVLQDPKPTDEWKQRVWKDGVGNIDEHGNGVRRRGAEFVAFDDHVNLINTVQRWFIEETRLGIPVDFTNEGIRGLCHANASNFPSQLGVGAAWDRDLVRRIGVITGKEGKALGYSTVYSPILDVVRDPRWGRTIECYGESPYHVGELGKQQTLGLQSQGVASSPKHFAVYSTPHGGRDARGRTDAQVPFRDMHQILLDPFRKVFMEAGAMGTMGSYSTYDGVPISGSRYFLTELLREEYGFNGYVVSDSGAIERIHQQHRVAADWEDAIAQAVNAGMNVRTDFQPTERFVLPLREAVRRGKISMQTINARVADVLRNKFRLGLFDEPFGDPERALRVVYTEAHEATTLEAARKALVLLKNDNSALPLDADRLKTLLVTGPGADDPEQMISRYGPSMSDVITPLAGIEALVGDRVDVLHAEGCDWRDDRFPGSDILPEPPMGRERSKLDAAIAAADRADAIVVVVGDSHETVGESRSRTSLDLPGHQTLLVQQMVKTGKPVIVVLMAGRAASINWIDNHVDGILACWHGGEKVGQAVAEAVFGDYNPGGKLPITFPRTVGQIPLAMPHRHGAWGRQNRRAGPNGWGSTRMVKPLYYLGHGLSYTCFEYDNLKIEPANATADDAITITCELTNTGDRPGDEVPQLYIEDVVASVTPYTQMLRGFERVSLEPGQTKTVRFKVDPRRDLRMLDRHNAWIVEPGEYKVRVATSSALDGVQLQGWFEIR